MIYVLGHKTPDTDSMCTPLVVSWYLNTILGVEAQAVAHGTSNRETTFVLNYWGVKAPQMLADLPNDARVFLVDSTNPEELPLIREDTEIVEVIDHHKMGGLQTNNATKVTTRPWGCTATVFYHYTKHLVEGKLPKEMAGLLASAIISDTLYLRSPITTDEDRIVLKELCAIAGIEDPQHYANEMFTAKSSIEGMDLRDIIKSDFKEFSIKGKSVFVGTFETVKPQSVLEKANDLVQVARKLKVDSGYDQLYFFVVDILEQHAFYFPIGDVENKIIAQGYGVEVSADPDHIVTLEGVVSRKKQIIPVLEASI